MCKKTQRSKIKFRILYDKTVEYLPLREDNLPSCNSIYTPSCEQEILNINLITRQS